MVVSRGREPGSFNGSVGVQTRSNQRTERSDLTYSSPSRWLSRCVSSSSNLSGLGAGPPTLIRQAHHEREDPTHLLTPSLSKGRPFSANF